MSTIQEQIRKMVTERIESENKDIELYNAILPIIRQFEGKPINKRIATAIQKQFPDASVYYEKKYTWYEVRIWGKSVNRDYNNLLALNLGYESETCIKESRFVELNARNGTAAIARNQLRESFLNKPENIQAIANKIEQVNTLLSEIDKLTDYPLPDGYAIKALVTSKFEVKRS